VPADETTAMAVPGPVPVPVPEPGPAAPEPGPVTPEPDDATAVLPVVDLPPTHAAAAPGTLVCPACGLANEPTRVYCRRCATELAAAAGPDTTPVHARAAARPVRTPGGRARRDRGRDPAGAVGAFALLPRDAPTPSSAVTASVPPVTAPPTAPPSEPVASPSSEPTAPPTEAPSVSTPPTIESLTGLIVFSA